MLLKCMDILKSTFVNCDMAYLKNRTALIGLFEGFVVPALKSTHDALMNGGVACLGLAMLMDVGLCKEKIGFIFGAFESGEFDVASLKVLFDVVSFYGLSIFEVD